MPANLELERLAQLYSRFASVEARGSSAIYEDLAFAISQSHDVLRFVASLPADRQQPNLLLAAIRHVAGGVPATGAQLANVVHEFSRRLRETILTRTTQTNEPGRCAALVPVLAQLQQPLALLEVGASAGLCLLPDRYSYDYGWKRLLPRSGMEGKSPVFHAK